MRLTRTGTRMAIAMAALIAAGPLAAQTTPPTGLRAELLQDLDGLEKKYVSLAGALPQERYGWRPGTGVRSVSEVFMHVADANYMIAEIAGFARPATVPAASRESITDKAQVVEALRASLAHARAAIVATPDANLDRAVKLFGRDATVRATLVLMVAHLHEHLGQSIAYARSVGTVPPWSGGE